jgi:hypothetical protein
MKKKIISWLSYMTVLVFLLQSCRHDELTNPENSSPNGSSLAAKYASKSPWKEDEVYISKVQQVFLKHANLPRVNETYGEPHWEYAMSFGQFGERYALVPVVKNNKVTLIMEAVRKENKVYFYEKKDADLLQFFNYLLYSPTSDYTETTNGADTTGKAKYVCTTRTFIVGCGNGPTDCVPIISSQMVCEWKEDLGSGIPPQTFDPCGDPFGGGCGGGGGDGGFEYPEPPQETPCEKIKAQSINANYKAKIEALDKPSILSMKKETGFSESKSGIFTDLPQAASTGSSDGMTITVTPDTKGYIHTHLNDYETGTNNNGGLPIINQPIRIFSPADVNTLMTMADMTTDGDYSQLYGTMVSSYGNYTIMFTGIASDIKTGFDTEQWRLNYIAYREKNPYWSFEKLFLNFLKDEMNVQGVELYKIKSNGSVQKKTLNSNKSVQSSDCP